MKEQGYFPLERRQKGGSVATTSYSLKYNNHLDHPIYSINLSCIYTLLGIVDKVI